MTVRELMVKLEKIEDKDLDVVLYIEGERTLCDEVDVSKSEYYGKWINDTTVWEMKERTCIVLS